VTDKLQDTASRVVSTVQDAAAPVLDQAGERASQVADQVMDQATSRLDIGKEYAVETLNSVAQALHQTGKHLREDGSQPTLGHYADSGAQQIERFSGYLHRRDTNQLLFEVESYARRNPLTFAGGAFALGLVAARFFRASGQRFQSTSTMGGTSSGRFSQLTPSSQYGSHTGTTPRSPMGQRSGGLSGAPAARNIPASPEWSPSTASRTPTSTNPGTRAPHDDQLTPIPGSLPSLGSSSPGSSTSSRPGGSASSTPGGSTSSTPGSSPTRPAPGNSTTPSGKDRPESDRPSSI